MTRLRVATTNPGKIREFREILSPLGHEIVGIDDLVGHHVVEDGNTFEENAIKKALAVWKKTGEPTVADDSGLVVDALGGAPGVRSARFADVGGAEKDAANRAKLLTELEPVPESERSARFVCVLAYVCGPGEPMLFRGTLEGAIGAAERGKNGFGYDPVFVLPESGRTAAELSSTEKNRVSHRGRAVQKLHSYLAKAAGGE